MMAIRVDNNKESLSREVAQRLFNKNVELESKRKKAAQARIPSDPNTWQQMRENYEMIILEDYAFSEQHDIEYALWQLHYRRIEELRALFNAALASGGSAASQNGKGPGRSAPDRIAKIRSQLKTFLSEATGFYHDLMLKIRAKYGLPLGYFSDGPDNHILMSKEGNKSSEVKQGIVSCHRCLIYLGDLARYKGIYGEGDSKTRDFTAASSYYMEASSLWPSSGNPHHQLAILAGYSNDELVSIYRYFRSLAVEIPFITARDNLIIAFEKNRQNYIQLSGDAKCTSRKAALSRTSGKGRAKGEARPSVKDNNGVGSSPVKERPPNNLELLKAFVTRFIRLNGILFTRTSLETFLEVFSIVKCDFLELLSSGPDEEFNFGLDGNECKLAIVRLIAILIFTMQNLMKENENQSYADILQRSVLLQNAFTATFEFMGCIFERCCQLNDPSSSYLLPGIMVFVEWLACHHDVAVCGELEEKQVNARSFWTKCISFLNKLIPCGYSFMNQDEDETCFSNMGKYDESETGNCFALPEDVELRGFLPLIPAQLILDFSRKYSFSGDGGNKERIARVERIIAAGKALLHVVRIGQEGVYMDIKLKKFVIGIEPQMTNNYLLSSPPISCLDANSIDVSGSNQVSVGFLPTLEVDVEDEEEDEVIVFKPSTMDKHMEELSSKFTPSKVLASVSGDALNELPCENGSLSIGDNCFPVRSAVSMKPHSVFPDSNFLYMQTDHPGTTNWLVQHNQLANGLAHINLMENDPSLKSELKDQNMVSQPVPLSLHNSVTDHNYPMEIPHAASASKFSSIIPSEVVTDSISVKQTSIMPSGLKKNPVSRPVRHLGPPPGFVPFRNKVLDEPMSSMALKNGNPQIPHIDDYSWLDGYHLSSSNQSTGMNSSINQSMPNFLSVSNSNGSMGLASFPFPGKQLSTLQVQSESHKGWQDHQFAGNTKPYSGEQQQQFQKGNPMPVGPTKHYQVQAGNQHSVGTPQHYQGQSIWDGRFFV